jgi:hypothetical protein
MLGIREHENVSGSSLDEFNKTINLLVAEGPSEKMPDSPAIGILEGDCKCQPS